MSLFTVLLKSLLCAGVVSAVTTPPSGALVVGKGGQYSTISQAVAAASPGKTIFIQPGTYNEQVWIQKNDITLIGYSEKDDGYSGNKVTITHNFSQKSGKNNDQTGTVRAHGSGGKFYNINFANSYGKGSQALALSAKANKLGFYGCQFTGFQDTVSTESGASYFGKCMISGATDFIFGQTGQTWIEDSDIRVVNNNVGYITANGRNSGSSPSYYVINKSRIGGSAPKGAFYLGRPWREYSRVVFQNCVLSNVINEKGWIKWNNDQANTAHVEYGEYGNTGPGASGSRASFARKLSSPVSMSTVLGSTNWIDTKWMSK